LHLLTGCSFPSASTEPRAIERSDVEIKTYCILIREGNTDVLLQEVGVRAIRGGPDELTVVPFTADFDIERFCARAWKLRAMIVKGTRDTVLAVGSEKLHDLRSWPGFVSTTRPYVPGPPQEYIDFRYDGISLNCAMVTYTQIMPMGSPGNAVMKHPQTLQLPLNRWCAIPVSITKDKAGFPVEMLIVQRAEKVAVPSSQPVGRGLGGVEEKK